MKIKRILYVEDDASAFDTLGNQIAESFAVISLGSERGTDYLKYVFQNKNKRVVVELLCVKNSSNAKKWIEEQPFDLAFIDYQLANCYQQTNMLHFRKIGMYQNRKIAMHDSMSKVG